MNAGRKPKPNAIKKLEGTYRKDRDNHGLQISTISEIPEAPEYLNEIAKKYFTNVCLTLKELGVLTNADIYLVVLLAQNLTINEQAWEKIKSEDSAQETQNGYTTISGWFSVFDKTNKKIMELSNLFGLSPSARERIRMQPKKEEDEIDKLLK